MISFEELERLMKEEGYFAENELLYDAYNALCIFASKKIGIGQDIFAMCLEGPPGAGKTEFAKVYTAICKKIFKNNVELVDYQCDATTGKTELFEDINISAAIRRDADNVNIPGKLIEAINKVNSGYNVVLFIDEYDKAREETDAFLLQFLQSGKINSTQHGDLEINPKYKGNLQVILCKNDMREELSGPLSRRIRITRLDYMRPDIFYQVAHRVLVEKKDDNDKVDNGLLNLVVLMYEQAYASREVYNRLPSCSEMLIAIEDANRLLKRANAPQNIIYNCIIRNMFKSIDDIKTFEKSLTKATGDDAKKLAELIKKMKSTESTNTNVPIELKDLIAETILKDTRDEVIKKKKELEDLIAEYQIKFSEMEKKRQESIDREVQRILLENGKLVLSNTPQANSLFDDEAAYVKRGFNIFNTSEGDWMDVGEVLIPDLSQHDLIVKLTEHAKDLDIKIYENGVLIHDDGDVKLIVIHDTSSGSSKYRFLSNNPVVPPSALSDIQNFITFMRDVCNSQPKNPNQVTNQVIGTSIGAWDVDTLVYSDTPLDFDCERENVYHVKSSATVEKVDNLKNIVDSASCADDSEAVRISQEILRGKAKGKTYE